MGFLFKRYKTKFRYSLQPIFAVLAAREKELAKPDWEIKVVNTKISILNNPIEYLGPDLPEPDLLSDILDEIFKEFLKYETSKYKKV